MWQHPLALLGFLVVSAIVLGVAYHLLGGALARLLGLSDLNPTPAQTQRDGLDFEPIRPSYLLPQHFSAIAAAGPIVGPILAGLYFGWGPAWLWIIFGSIFIGGIHDITALLASVRHRGRSIAEIVRQYMNPRAYVLFLLFIWFALIYVIIAFTDVTAGAFVAQASQAEASAPGPAVATSSLLYLGLAIAMGLVLRTTGVGPGKAKLVFLPLVFAAIVVGPSLPLDLSGWVSRPQQVWGYVLLAYCFFAAIAPVWLLLQPRGDLGGYFLYIVMAVAVAGIGLGSLTGGLRIEQPFFSGWTAPRELGGMPLFPILFITVACGACSGFHSIVASGTTSKQLARETDAKSIGYGAMLLEGLFACLSLATFMVLADKVAKPDLIYANGITAFAVQILRPVGLATGPVEEMVFTFALLCFATFVFDTLDACTRLSRYVLMELLGWKTFGQTVLATGLTLVIPVAALSLPPATLNGKPLPLWQVFWGIFGSSNQLLAALTLLAVTVWFARKGLPWRITLWPTVFMMAMTLWSLWIGVKGYWSFIQAGGPVELMRHVQFVITLGLIGLSVWLMVEAMVTWREIRRSPAEEVGEPATADAI